MSHKAKLDEIDRNYDAFQRQLGRVLLAHDGEFALIKGGEIVGFYPRVRDASDEAGRRFADGIYSIQQVVEDPIDLGFFSHAGS